MTNKQAFAGHLLSTTEPDLSWVLIAVGRTDVVILDYSPGWDDFGIEFFWEDTFDSEAPRNLRKGAYLYTDYKIGMWEDGEHIRVTGGKLTPYLPFSASVDERPEGQDPQGLGAQHASAVGEAETPNPSRPIPDTLNAGGCE